LIFSVSTFGYAANGKFQSLLFKSANAVYFTWVWGKIGKRDFIYFSWLLNKKPQKNPCFRAVTCQCLKHGTTHH
jgi:hypothetical protein